MKTQNKEAAPKGEGHKARIAVLAKAKVEMDGKVSEFNIDYDVTVTIEHIDYIVRQIAGGIAQAAGEVAKNGISGRSKIAA